jgi:hypothetical protein
MSRVTTHLQQLASLAARARVPLLLTMGGVGVGMAIFFSAQLLASPTNSSGVAAPVAGEASDHEPSGKGATNAGNGQKGATPWSNQAFVEAVMEYTAARLRLSPAQLADRLQAGEQIAEVAAHQGASAQDLHTIELDALQRGLAMLVNTQRLTQGEANGHLEHWRQRDPQQLNDDFTLGLGGVTVIPKGITPASPSP